MGEQKDITKYITVSRRLVLLVVCLLTGLQTARAQFSFHDEPALQVINDIEQSTPFHFLYRDALLADISLSFSADSNTLFRKLRTALRFHRLDLNIDRSRHQVIISG